MLKTLTAYTLEVDDIDVAIADLKKQLDLDNNLLKNSVGILSCNSDFIETGVVKAISEQFPFEIIGDTTLGTAVTGELGQIMLSLAVLTSDEVSFSCAVTSPLEPASLKESLETAYKKAVSSLSEKPSMIITFAPFLPNISGDDMVKNLDEISGGIPIFGNIPSSHTKDYSDGRTIYGGKEYSNALAMAVFGGDAKPVFTIASISDDRILKQKAVVTASKGNVLMSINDMVVKDYLESINLAPKDRADGLISIPFVLDFNDGTQPVARSIFKLTSEGYAVCGGAMPVNATLGIGLIDHDEVLATAKTAMEKILSNPNRNGLLIFSCGARNMALGFDTLAEMEVVKKYVGDKVPYFLGYSGGEICPVYNEEGKLVNRFHNDTIVSCIF